MLPCIPKRSRYLGDVDIKHQKAISREIDKLMKRDKRKFQSRHNILLLGTGESGKSTFLKQMKIINGKKFTSEEIAVFRDTIYDNVYKGILFLIDARKRINIELENPEDTSNAANRVEEHYNRNKDIHRELSSTGKLVWKEKDFLSLVDDISMIWSDKGIKETFNQRSKTLTEVFSENSRYYLNKLDKIRVKDYQPTNEDIVWSRKPTDSIIEEEIDIRGACIVFIDVGGQTKERKKWCQVFQDMNSVLFLIASSHFDEHYRDKMAKEYRNKLREAMRVFEDLINIQYFLTVSVILFFNKTDVLTEKVTNKVSNIRNEFPEYPDNFDPHNLVHVQQFLVDSFVSFVDNPGAHSRQQTNRSSLTGQQVGLKKRTLYRHFTTAVDQRNIETVFDAMKDTIVQRNIDQLVMK